MSNNLQYLEVGIWKSPFLWQWKCTFKSVKQRFVRTWIKVTVKVKVCVSWFVFWKCNNNASVCYTRAQKIILTRWFDIDNKAVCVCVCVCAYCAIEWPRLFQACWLGSAHWPCCNFSDCRGSQVPINTALNLPIHKTAPPTFLPDSINNPPRSRSTQRGRRFCPLFSRRLRRWTATLFIQLSGQDSILVSDLRWLALFEVCRIKCVWEQSNRTWQMQPQLSLAFCCRGAV